MNGRTKILLECGLCHGRREAGRSAPRNPTVQGASEWLSLQFWPPYWRNPTAATAWGGDMARPTPHPTPHGQAYPELHLVSAFGSNNGIQRVQNPKHGGNQECRLRVSTPSTSHPAPLSPWVPHVATDLASRGRAARPAFSLSSAHSQPLGHTNSFAPF